jgi:hypothetical protein
MRYFDLSGPARQLLHFLLLVIIMNVTYGVYGMSSDNKSNKRKTDDNSNLRDLLAEQDEIDAIIADIDNNNDYRIATASTMNVTEESSPSNNMYQQIAPDESNNININLLIDDDQSSLTSQIGSLTGTSTSSLIGSRTGRPPIQLYLTCDDDVMSAYQCVVRKQVELFEADIEDVETNAQGRNKPIMLGQVGVRCRHCNLLHPKQRTKGAVYYPTKLDGIYQAVNNMANIHLEKNCQIIDDWSRQHLITLRNNRSISGGGKTAWAERAAALGVFEDNQGLHFEPSIGYRQGINLRL